MKGGKLTGRAYYYLWQYVKRGKGESASVIGEQGERGGEMERGGSSVTKRNWVTKGRGGVYVCIKIYIYK